MYIIYTYMYVPEAAPFLSYDCISSTVVVAINRTSVMSGWHAREGTSAFIFTVLPLRAQDL